MRVTEARQVYPFTVATTGKRLAPSPTAATCSSLSTTAAAGPRRSSVVEKRTAPTWPRLPGRSDYDAVSVRARHRRSEGAQPPHLGAGRLRAPRRAARARGGRPGGRLCGVGRTGGARRGGGERQLRGARGTRGRGRVGARPRAAPG